MLQLFPSLIVVSLLFVVGCGTATKSYTYNLTITNVPAETLSDVEVRILKGIDHVEMGGSLNRPFTIKTEVLKGSIPGSPKVKRINIRFFHGLADPFLVGQTNLTLVFTQEGDLHRVNGLPVNAVGPPK